jgi:alcohol dehydrogenase class IV
VVTVNLRALETRLPDSPALARYSEIARLFHTRDLAGRLSTLCQALNVEPLRNYGVERESFAEIAANAARASSMKANPVALTPEEVLEILDLAY